MTTLLDRADATVSRDVVDAAALDVLDAPGAVDAPDAPASQDVADVSDALALADVMDATDADAGFSRMPPSPVVQVTNGFLHSCARLSDGSAWCWGHNEQGQVGAGTSALWHARAQRVPLRQVVEIVAGAYHTCARTDARDLYCWGRNTERQVGVEPADFVFEPTRVEGLSDVTALAAGGAHTCAVTSAGEVWCWGSNLYGALGVSAAGNVAAPSRVVGVTARFVAAGEAFSCAGGGASVWCWGRNAYGELGATSASVSSTSMPRRVNNAVSTGGELQALFAGGFAVCARSADATRCWGRGDFGALGNGNLAPEQSGTSTATLYAGFSPVLGYTGQCRVAANGTTTCWGTNDLGANGTGTALRANAPDASLAVNVARHDGAPVLSVGAAHTCGLSSTGTLHCWGARYFGQLGDGVPAVVPTPVRASAWEPSLGLALGRAFTCALRRAGSSVTNVLCAGYNGVGQLGGSSRSATPLPTVEPVPVAVRNDNFFGTFLSVSPFLEAGGAHACALGTDATARCWGYNAQGQLNRGPSSTTFFGAIALQGVLPPRVGRVSAGEDHTCVVDESDQVRCWGANGTGQLGVAPPSTTQGSIVPGITAVTQVEAAAGFTCVRSTSGSVTCFGANSLGQCGLGTNTASVTPATSGAMTTLSSASSVAAGLLHACALTAEGVSCWGSNNRGQCGASNAERTLNRPTLVVGTAGATDLKIGGSFSCMVRSGQVWCWGSNTRGQLGDGTFLDRATPAPVMLPTGDAVEELGVGEEHACARLASGQVHCWGSNQLGQLGLSSPLWVLSPQGSTVEWTR